MRQPRLEKRCLLELKEVCLPTHRWIDSVLVLNIFSTLLGTSVAGGGGGGGGWMDCCLKLAAPIGLSPLAHVFSLMCQNCIRSVLVSVIDSCQLLFVNY